MLGPDVFILPLSPVVIIGSCCGKLCRIKVTFFLWITTTTKVARMKIFNINLFVDRNPHAYFLLSPIEENKEECFDVVIDSCRFPGYQLLLTMQIVA